MESSYLGASPAYGIFQRQVIIGDGSTTTFDLDYQVSSSTQILVSLDGIIQEPEYSYSAYTTAGQGTINFSEPVDANGRVFITYMGRQLLVPTQALSSPHSDSFTGDGSTTNFTMTRPPSVGNGTNIILFVNSTFQIYGTDYTTSGETIFFTTAPTSAAVITAIQLAESNNTIDTVQDNSITAAKLSLSYTTTTHTGDGSTAAFTIESGHDVNSVLVFYNGICMVPTTDYTIATNQLTFTFAPVNGSNIMMRYLPV
jgi:hypothetical protein